MEDIIDIIVTETTNLIEITSQPTDEIIDVNIIDNREDVTLNVTPTVVEININSLTGNFGINWGEITGTLSNQTDLNTALGLKADLVGGKVPSSQLPSYVDDVVEVANYAALPATGETGKIYITIDTNYIYRWTGSVYVEIKDSSAVWGAITGTLSNQTDLQSALNAKANDNAVVHLAGTETITGAKTFSANLTAGASAFFNNGILLKDGATSSASGHFAISSLSSTTLGFSSSGGRAFDLIMPTSGGAITVPNGSGTLALTSDLHNAVTIGTANGLSLSTQVLSLGLASSSANGALSSTDWTTFNNKQNALGYTAANDSAVVHLSGNESISGVKTFTTQVNSAQLRFSESGGFGNVAGFTQIGGTADYFNVINGTNTKGAQFTYSGGGNVYTLPASSGTLALTSALSSYLPLAGGTLTGALSGTSATFTTTGKDALTVSDSTTQAAGVGGSILFKGVYTNGGSPLSFGRISLEKQNSTNADYSFNLAFYTSPNGGANPNNTAALKLNYDNSATFSSSVQTTNLFVGTTGTATSLNSIQSPYGILSGLIEANVAGNAYYNSGWKYYGNGPTGLFNIDTGGNFGFYTAASGVGGNNITLGNAKVTFTNAGNVGIGTTSPSWMFEVNKDTSSGSFGQYPAISVNNPNASGYSAYYFFSGSTNKGGFEYSNSTNALSIYGNGSERMRINSGGNVGIGTTTISTNSLIRELVIGQGITNGVSKLSFRSESNSLTSDISLSSYLGENLMAISTTSNIPMLFVTNSTERMRITSGGNVLIGTSFAPAGNGLGIAIYKNDYPRITFRNSTTGDQASGGFQFYLNGNDFYQESPGNTIFANGGTERMRITSGGVVLINQTSLSSAGAGQKFQVATDMLTTGSLAGYFFENRSGGVTSNSNWYGWYATSGTIYMFNGASNIASINTSSGAYTALSDINKKKDFEDSSLGLNAILGLKPKLFRMKDQDESSSKQLGFIAQEVKDFIPQAYIQTKGEKEDFIGLDDRPIIATLVKAVQEQQVQIQELKQQLANK